MALPEMCVKITADTTDVQTDFTKLNQTLDRLEDKIGMTVNASGRLVDKFGQTKRVTKSLEEAMQKAGVKTDDLADVMLQVRNQATGLGRAMKVANDNIRAAGTTALPQATRSSSAFGRSLQNVSFQVGDFATQVGAGTAASVALGQQLPQLLGGFGILGAALGAVVAIAVPLTKSLVSMTEGAKLTSDQFGSFGPVIVGVADAFKSLKPIISDALGFLAEHLEKVLLGGAAVAAFFAGKWVASFAAARIATLTLAGSLSALRGALIATGFGALIVGLGTLVQQLMNADSWLRVFLARIGLLTATTKKQAEAVAEETRQEIAALEAQQASSRAAAERIGRNIEETDTIKNRAEAIRRLTEKLKSQERQVKSLAEAEASANAPVVLLDFSKEDDSKDKLKKDIEDREKLRKEEMQRQRERLQEGLQAIRESQLTERQMLFAHLLEKKALIDEAYENDLVTDAERKQLWLELQAEHNRKMLELEDRKQQQEAAKKGALFQQISNLQKGELGEQLSNNVKYWGQLVQQSGVGGKRLFAVLKIFGAAESLINAFRAFNQVLADPTLGFYAKFAAAAAVLASGLQMVAAIQSASMGGGGGGGGGAASAAAGRGGGNPTVAPQETRPRGPSVSLTLVGDQGFSRAQIVQIAEALNDAGDEGQLVQITGRR